MTTKIKNKIRAILAYSFRIAALLCVNGSLMQTFLNVIGFSERHIYLHATLFQAVNVMTILLCARFADNKSVLKRTAIVQIPGALLFLFYLPLCLLKNVTTIAYVWLLAISVLQSIVLALHTICEYKTPYYLYRIDEYGIVLSICGILSSAVSFGVGLLISLLSVQYSYNKIMFFAFGISCLFLLLSAILQYFQKSLLSPDDVPIKDEQTKKIPLMTVLRHETFSKLFAANLTRGFATGTTTILAAAALSIGYDKTLTSAMVSVSSLANLAACALFAITARRIPPRFVILVGSLFYITFPLLLIKDQPILYLVMYALLFFGRTLIDYAVPAALLYVVPVEIAGIYNAWRMIIQNAGVMLATILAGFLPLPLMFVVSMACQVFSGINFCTAKVMSRK